MLLKVSILSHGRAMQGGMIYNLLQRREGAFIAVLHIVVDQAAQLYERHAVAFLAGMQVQGRGECCGAIVDNDPRIPVLLIEEKDRASPEAARAVFDALFCKAESVRITALFQLQQPSI